MEEGVVFAERNQRSAEGQGQKAARWATRELEKLWRGEKVGGAGRSPRPWKNEGAEVYLKKEKRMWSWVLQVGEWWQQLEGKDGGVAVSAWWRRDPREDGRGSKVKLPKQNKNNN
jgi:hypothetical protein